MAQSGALDEVALIHCPVCGAPLHVGVHAELEYDGTSRPMWATEVDMGAAFEHIRTKHIGG